MIPNTAFRGGAPLRKRRFTAQKFNASILRSIAMNEDEFYLKTAYALSGCQLVEQELKLYVTAALDLVRKCVGTRMTFDMRGEDYENSSLERLIEIFKKLSSNDDLVKDLRKFKDERNFLSHRGITHCLDYEGELFWSTVQDFQARLEAIQSEANRLRNAVHEEAGKFLGHLYFEDMPDIR